MTVSWVVYSGQLSPSMYKYIVHSRGVVCASLVNFSESARHSLNSFQVMRYGENRLAHVY